jgi:hypothetical protein
LSAVWGGLSSTRVGNAALNMLCLTLRDRPVMGFMATTRRMPNSEDAWGNMIAFRRTQIRADLSREADGWCSGISLR